MKDKKEIAIRRWNLESTTQLSGMALVLKTHIVKNKLFTEISGKNYVHVEGWQFAGGLLGMIPEVVSIKDLSNDKEVKWLVEVQIIKMSSGKMMSRGFAICSNKEAKKRSFDEYAVLSMAQTRAIGKAYRNLLGWVMKLAGYEGTPSEEMKKVNGKESQKSYYPPTNQGKESVAQAFKCSQKNCVMPVSKTVHDYSMQVFKKSLCREHQKQTKK